MQLVQHAVLLMQLQGDGVWGCVLYCFGEQPPSTPLCSPPSRAI